MADDYIERKFEDYQARKAAWEKSRRLGLNKKKIGGAPSTETPEQAAAEYDDKGTLVVDDTLVREDD